VIVGSRTGTRTRSLGPVKPVIHDSKKNVYYREKKVKIFRNFNSFLKSIVIIATIKM